MSKIQQRDYYYGAALSLFLSKNIDSKPSLIESNDKACIYKMTTDTSEDFFVYMKYTGKEILITNDERIWQFSLTETDKNKINECIATATKTYIILICGCEQLNEGEVAVLTQKEYCVISHKTGIRVKLVGKSPKRFIIVDRDSDKSLFIERNRFDNRLTDIKDSL